MAEIKCPMCGKPNPAERDVCQYCEARLKPVTDELSRSQPPIRPGEEPTEIDTGQLESVLPKWLRDIRQQARESDEGTGQPPQKEEAGQGGEQADLLAGLRSQAEDAEEIPDWLAGLRGEGGQVGFEESSTDDEDMAALRNMLGDSAPVPKESEASGLPDWISGRSAEEAEGMAEEPAQPEPQPSASGSDFSWEADLEPQSTLPADSTEGEKPFDSELPAWLQDTDKAQIDETAGDLPAWLRSEEPQPEAEEAASLYAEGELPAWLQDKDESSKEEGDTGLPAWLESDRPVQPAQEESTTPASEADLPGWLASLGEEESGEAVPPQVSEPPAARSTTDWLASFEEENVAAAPPDSTESAIKSTTDWLASLDEETAETAPQQEAARPAEGEMPDRLSSLGAPSSDEPLQQDAEEPASIGGLPGWLAALGDESTTKEEEGFSSRDELVEPSEASAEAAIPDWLAAMGEPTAASEEPAEELESPIYESATPADETGMPSAFVDDEGRPISQEDVDAIFSMDMPDWLSDAGGVSQAEAEPAVAEPGEDELRPAELPSWVQAMRPVESVISETEGVPSEEQPVEERGPLAGLRGVLPAVPGVGPSSKPKAYAIKLQASEDQQSSAALLEQILAEESAPKAVTPQKALLNQRLLRLAITILFLSIVAVITFSGTRINPISTSVPPETKDALDYVQLSLPANAPVLMVFDYEAARSGELEAVALPLVDQMLTLKSPRLGLISTTPVGPGLAERFMELLQTDREFVRNQNFVNLGYVPGGASGVQAFAGNPVNTKPLTTSGEEAWSTPVLQDVAELSDFAAIFLLTDDVETARAWIEQTEGNRGETRLLVFSSAQSGPMILPYVRSGQVAGMVAGLESSAPIEQANSGRPGMARRYWDAYGFGLLTAVVMIALGSLWSLFSGWQAYRKEQGEA